jgi:glycosyltransferase involved in cell wall biosynthesis
VEKPTTAMLHYTAAPVVGGVEGVIQAHAEIFLQNGYPVTVVAGRGEGAALPPGTDFTLIPELDSRHPQIEQMTARLVRGEVPADFDAVADYLAGALAPILGGCDNVVVHNVLTMYYNLPLSAALTRLVDEGVIRRCIGWCHDFTWASPRSRAKVHPGYPWDLLRTYREDITYVVVSQRRRETLAALFERPEECVRVIYNGVDPGVLLGLSEQGRMLVARLGLLTSDLVLLMPVRVTKAKNVEGALHLVAELKARGLSPRLVLTGPPDPHDADSMAYFHELQALRGRLGVEQEMRFVFEEGPDPGQPLTIGMDVVGDLFRVSDMLFMPSHREGFGMPVLEAALVGMPIVSTEIPAAVELGSDNVILFEDGENPAYLAGRIIGWLERSPVYRLRRQVRQNYTWDAIFHRDIEPLLAG